MPCAVDVGSGCADHRAERALTKPGAETATRHVERLSGAELRRLVIFALVRCFLAVLVLVGIYFVLPLERLMGALSAAEFVVGVLIVAVVLVWQIRATMRSRTPTLRAIESLGVLVPLVLLLFALAHYLVEVTYPGSYSEEMTRLDSLYYSVTMFATVGFGDIAPVSNLARVISMLQMLGNLIFLGVVARVLFGAALEQPSLTRSRASTP
jgi:voltage-gated potassium channel